MDKKTHKMYIFCIDLINKLAEFVSKPNPLSHGTYNGRGIIAVNLVGGVGVKQTSIVYY